MTNPLLGRAQVALFNQALVTLYRQAEGSLIGEIARRLAIGIDSPNWMHQQAAQIGGLRRFAETLMSQLGARGRDISHQGIALSMADGRRRATGMLAHLVATSSQVRNPGLAALSGHGLPGIDRTSVLAETLVTKIQRTHPAVASQATTAYRQIMTRATAEITLGASTQRQAAQHGLDDLINSGLTTFRDSAGRRWNLASYVDMASRTANVQASVQSHLDTLAQAGVSLVQVSNSPAECYLCRPWEGKVLDAGPNAPNGPHTVRVQHGIDDRYVDVQCAGSVGAARDAGLLHPNCRHTLGAYIPGVTSAVTNTADPEGAAARDQLRSLERATRNAKLRQQTALTPEAKTAAGQRVRDLQGQIRSHVAANPGLQRQSAREQIDLGLHRPPDPPPVPRPPSSPPPGVFPGSGPATHPPQHGVSDYYHRNLDGIQDMEDAVASGYREQDVETFSRGRSATTEWVTTNNGTTLVRKSGGADNEQVASIMGRAMGIDSMPRVYRDHPSYVYMDLVPGKTGADLQDEAMDAVQGGDRYALATFNEHVDRLAQSPAGQRVGLFDQLTANTDRNLGNWLLNDDGAGGEVISPIDHGHAFSEARIMGPPRLYGGGPFARNYAIAGTPQPNQLTPGDIVRLRARLESTRPDMLQIDLGRQTVSPGSRQTSQAKLDYALAVLRLLEPYAQGTVDLFP